MRPGTVLRIQASAPFRLHWTATEWATATETSAAPTAIGLFFVDLPVARDQAAPIRFTFYWPEAERWEGRDFHIDMAHAA